MDKHRQDIPGAGRRSLSSSLRFLALRFALHFRRASRSIWIHGDSFALFAEAEGLIAAIRRAAPQHRLLLTAGRPDVVEQVQARFLDDLVRPSPVGFRPVVRRVLKILSPKALVLLGSAAGLDHRCLQRVQQAGVPVFLVNAAAPSGLPEGFRPDRTFTRDDGLDAVLPYLPQDADRRPGQQSWGVGGIVYRLMGTAPGRMLLELRSRKQIDTWDALGARLGRPKTILCLGNGPSSEDPRLRGVEYDSLFRVNWAWKQRGFLAEPDVVFVGDPATVYQVNGCIFAFRRTDFARKMVLDHLLSLRLKPLEFFSVEAAGSFACDPEAYAHPTNGALMVAAAAALQPERLVVAGIDLFLHPDGRYPGDARGLNEPSPMHDRDNDVRIIAQALKMYRGEVMILSDLLKESLERFAKEAARQPA